MERWAFETRLAAPGFQHVPSSLPTSSSHRCSLQDETEGHIQETVRKQGRIRTKGPLSEEQRNSTDWQLVTRSSRVQGQQIEGPSHLGLGMVITSFE